MKKNHAAKQVVYHLTPHIPGLDDYELPAEVPFDPAKMRPNPFAGRVKFTHGGKRNGSGRKPAPERLERHTVTLYKAQVKYLRKLDSNLSRAIRMMIDAKAR